MKLELEVLASVSIKRKKPWPRVVFLGEVQESLFLIDNELQRLSVLYVPSGKTKRKIPRLTPMLPNVVTLTTTDNGHFICGILNSGDLFLWHKDSDTIKYIKGLPEFRQKIAASKTEENKLHHAAHKPFLHVSGDGSKLVLVLDLTKIYVWEMDPGQLFFKFRKGKLDKQSHLQGGWTSVMTTVDTPLPDDSCKEVCLDGSFFVSEGVYGLCCSLVYVYNRKDSICVSTLLIKWFDAQNITSWSSPVFHSEWTSITYPLNSIALNIKPIPSTGAYIAKISHDGQLVAIAVNQECSHDNRMLFVSPWTDTVVVANMRGSGARVPVTANHRMYWVADLAWTYDDLFVACALKQGTLCFLTRLGEPALLQTFGCSIEMGPKPFMPLHPVISVRPSQLAHTPADQSVSESMEEIRDSRRQRFSVSSHPLLPIVIFSDGYMVSVVYLPGEPTCLSLMKGLCMESGHHLRKLQDSQRVQISLFDSMKKRKSAGSKTSVKERSAHRLGLSASNNMAKKTRFSEGTHAYHFEEAPVDVLENNYDSDVDGDYSPQIAGMDQGVLDFGDIGNLNTTLDYRKLDLDEGLTLPELISRTQCALVLAWNLGASHTGLWTLDHETVMENVTDNLIQLFAVVLHTKAKMLKKVGGLVNTILSKSQKKSFPKKANKKLILVLDLYKSLMHTLRLDGHSRHLMVCATRFTYSNVRMLLSCESLSLKETKSKTLHGCYMVLQFAEMALSRIYTSIHSDLPWQNSGVVGQSDAYQPAIFVYTAGGQEKQERGVLDSEQTEVKTRVEETAVYTEYGGVVPVELRGVQRLGIAWLVLYKAALEGYQEMKQLTDTGQCTDQHTTKPKAEMRRIWSVLMLLQTKIHSLGLKLPLRNKFPLTEAEYKLVEGDDKKGEMLVVKELSNVPEPSIQGTKGCRLLLSMMYTLLGRGEVRAALELVEFLLRQTDVRKALGMSRQDRQTKASLLSLLQQVPDEKRVLPASTVQNSAVRHTVQSMARLMAAYFCNQDMYIFPAHAPKKLPPLHIDINKDNRVLPLSREALTCDLTDQCLDTVWTSDKALEYLLLCGALPEAVWLAVQLGDWKTAVMIGVAVTQHQNMCPLLYTKKNKLQLPEELHPQSIMKARLGCVTGTSDKPGGLLTGDDLPADLSPAALSDFLLCASLCELNFVPCLLEDLTSRLKSVSRQFSALVPDSLYLPAPPVYCPQPTPTDESRIPHAVLVEIKLRGQVSSLVQSLMQVLSSARCCLPAARWYVRKLMQAMTTGLKFKKNKSERTGVDIRVLHDSFLSETSVFEGEEKDSDIHVVLESFRDLCSVVWMLHARDQLSRALRKKAYLRQKMMKRCTEFTTDQWETQCQTCLQWAGHLLPFSHHLADADQELSGIYFSLVIEMQADDQAAKTLAQQFFDIESLHPEVQDKLQWLMRDWKKILLRNKPKTISLASYYDKVCEKFEKLIKRKQQVFGAFDHKVFSVSDKSSASVEVDETLYIGSRPSEIEDDFLKFVDEFYAVSFSKLIDEETEGYGGIQVPLLPRYQKEVKDRELYSDLHQAVTSFQKKQEYRDSARTKFSDMSPRHDTGRKYRDMSPRQDTGRKYRDISPRQDTGRNYRDMSPRQDTSQKVEKVKQKKQAKQNLAKRSLFRSKSFSEIQAVPPAFKPISPLKNTTKARSQEDLLDDVTDLPPITPRGDAVGFNGLHINSSTPRHKTSTPRRSKKAGESARATKLKKSSSTTDLNTGTAESKSFISMGPDPLASPVLEPWLLESLMFEEKYQKLECLLDWLNRWVSRNHANFGQHESPSKYSRQQSVIRIRVPPRMVLYSVWQLEHSYNQALKQQASKTRRQGAGQSTDKRKAKRGEWRKHISQDRMVIEPRMASPIRADFLSERVEYNHHREGVDSKPRGFSTSTGEVKDKPRRSRSREATADTKADRTSPNRTQHHNSVQGRRSPSRTEPTVLDNLQYVLNSGTEEPGKRRKGRKTKSGKKNKRKQLSEECDVEISIPVQSAGHTPRPLPEPPLLYRDSNLPNNAHKKKQLRVKDKSLDIVLNERFVYDMNINQNNGNNDENPTEENISLADTPRSSARGASKIGSIDDLTNDKCGVKVDNTNSNNSTGRKGNESIDTISDKTGQEIGRQVGKLVADRIQQQGNQMGQSTDALISSLSEMIDEELKKTMITLARFDKKELEISSPIPQDTVDGPEDMPLLSRSQVQHTRSPNVTFGAEGGLTDRSLLSNNSIVADEFRAIVRTELKKLIQAQHKGILTMLDSLDDQPDNLAKSKIAEKNNLPQNFDPFDPHASKPALKPQECVILTAQQQSAAVSMVSESKCEEEDTLTPVSSLSCSEMYTDRTPLDKPLTMSQLKASDTPPLKHKHHHHHKAGQVNGALRELQDLSHKYKHPPPHPPTLHSTQPFHPGQVQEATIQPTRVQEAMVQPAHLQPRTMQEHAQLGGSIGPLLHHDHSQPFGRLMSMLRQFNSEVGTVQGNMPPLLRMTAAEQSQGSRFPPIPTQAWPEQSTAHPAPGGPSHMPLLTSAPPHGAFDYQRYELPEKDRMGDGTHPAHPLLKADWGAEPFPNMRDQHGMPRLIPPQQLLQYEQSKYNHNRKKQLQDEIDDKLREVGSRSQQRVGARLLIPDVMEPFGEKDERDHEARQRRRQIKLQKPANRKARKAKEGRSAQKDSGQSGETEGEQSEAEVSQEDEISQEQVLSQRFSPPTKQERREVIEERDGVEGDVRIHQGYALTPGLFDEYLSQEDQQKAQADTYASLQYHAVTLMEREKQKLQSRKKNVAVATDNTMDKSTTMTKDTATNPVGEAISRYYRAKTGTNTGNVLPPDIYMGLRFTDTHEGQDSVTNAFLNVVDINSAEMLREIAATVPEREPQDVQAQALDMQGSPIQPRPRMKSAHQNNRVAAPQDLPTRDRSASPRRPAPDPVTVEVLGQPTHPGAPADEVVAGYRKRTGAHIKKRLMDMDEQFDAIATMTQNIEDDFKHTKVLLNTIEQMGEAIVPEDSARSPHRSTHTPRGITSPHTPRQVTSQTAEVSTEAGLSPSFVKRANQKEKDKESVNTPVSSTPRLVGEDGLTVEERIKDIRSSIQTNGLRWSGISDVDDIIGEVIAKGDVDVTEFGLSNRDVELLTARTLRSAREGDKVTSEQLEEIYRQKSPRHMPRRTEAEQRKLQQFMEKKRKEKMKEYRQQLNEMRERETKPFGGKGGADVKNKDLSEAEKLRLTNKQKREEDFSKEREREATQLMRDILEDKVPEQPVINRTVTLKPSANTRVVSPMGRTKTLKAASGRSPVRSVRRTDSSPDPAIRQGSNRYTTAQHIQRSRPQVRDHKQRPVRKSLEFSGEDQIRVFGIEHEEEDNIEGTGHTEVMQSTGPFEERVDTEDKENKQPQKVYKPKPFTDIVKMQKPEVLRETRNRSHKPVPYVERLSEMSTASTWRSSQPSPADQQRIPGSKRLKGAAKAKERTAQRVVKTYQERLHEMKQNRQYNMPIMQRSASSGRPSTNPLPPPQKTVSRKSKTYTEQLKALQPPKEQFRTGVAYVSRGQQPVRRSHGPIHSPKTYAQQLQELQPQGTRASSEYFDGHIYRAVPSSQRGVDRQRPYADPYSEAYTEEGDGALSPWSVEQDVRKMLYNGEDASLHTALSDMDLSEDDLALGADYVTLVPVDELEVASAESASVMSFIDWDQVEDIIADVQ